MHSELSFESDSADFVLSVPKTVEECIEELVSGIGDSSRCFVWRGQSNSSWKPYPGLYRRLQNNGYADSQIDESLVSIYERDLLCESNGLGFYSEAGGSRLSLMVRLQHAGGATRLLDVTHDPFVAMWFSSGGDSDCAGIIYRYAIDKTFHALPEAVTLWDDITSPKLAGMPILFTPRKMNGRIQAQSAAFLTTVLDRPLSEGSIFSRVTPFSSVKPILISADLKREIRKHLIESRGMREYDLFPDFEGFAQANRQTSAFPRKRSELYGTDYEELYSRRFNPLP